MEDLLDDKNLKNNTKEIVDLIRSNLSIKEKRQHLTDYHDNDIADVLDELTSEERKSLYSIIGIERTSEIFAYLEEDVGTYLEELDTERAADIIESMDSDDAIDALEELADEQREEIIELINSEAKEDIDLIQSFNDNEIGSRMTTNYVEINKRMNIRQAMKELVSQAAKNDNISTLYVVEDDGTFYGALELHTLIIAREHDDLESLVITSYPYVYADEEIDECIEYLKDYSEDSIPVLDRDKKLLGIITSQDIVEVVDEEMGEDYAKLAGLSEEEDLHEPLRDSIRKRMPWLIILLFLSLGVSAITGLFEPVMAQLTLIVSFQSLILGMSGNVGTQSLGVTIRVLSNDDDLETKDIRHLIFKEVRIGLSNGFILGCLTFTFIGLFVLIAKGQTPLFSFSVSLCIGLALMIAMGISSFTGTIIPITLKKFGMDPAVASGPLITTMNDLVAVITYYGTAWILLINTLHL
ncbi:MAG: magnesium transporter [Lachnospiraceae bacterium]|nr:magnesium transporter [Lachnospiraceae bacterium]